MPTHHAAPLHPRRLWPGPIAAADPAAAARWSPPAARAPLPGDARACVLITLLSTRARRNHPRRRTARSAPELMAPPALLTPVRSLYLGVKEPPSQKYPD